MLYESLGVNIRHELGVERVAKAGFTKLADVKSGYWNWTQEAWRRGAYEGSNSSSGSLPLPPPPLREHDVPEKYPLVRTSENDRAPLLWDYLLCEPWACDGLAIFHRATYVVLK